MNKPQITLTTPIVWTLIPKLIILGILVLGLNHCSTNQIKYFFESEEWDKICGCAPKDKDPSKFGSLWEAMGELELGALIRVGKDNYLARLYKGIKTGYEFQGSKFRKLPRDEYPKLETQNAKDVILEEKLEFTFLKIIKDGVDHKSNVILFDSNLFFQRGSQNLTPYSNFHIELIAQALMNYPDSILRIRVHTTNAGNEKANQTLSDSRAKSIQKELAAIGKIEEKRFRKVEGLGDKEKRTTESKLNLGNNRVEIYFETPIENEIDTYEFDKKLNYEIKKQ